MRFSIDNIQPLLSEQNKWQFSESSWLWVDGVDNNDYGTLSTQRAPRGTYLKKLKTRNSFPQFYLPKELKIFFKGYI